MRPRPPHPPNDDAAPTPDELLRAATPDDRSTRVIKRPDGFHWLTADGKREFGPYATLTAALADMDGADDDTIEPGESLIEAEQELGLSDWIDPDTGDLAEESVTRIDDEH